MALTYAEYYKNISATAGNITSDSFSVVSGDVICVVWSHENASLVQNLTVSNTNTAFTWNDIQTASAAGNCYVRGWYAVASASQSMTVSIVNDYGGLAAVATLSCIVHSGAHATTPVPAGKIYSGTSGNDVSQSITPTASGSCLWMAVADYNAANALAANANCSVESSYHDAAAMTTAIIRPTTQPRTDANAFTIGEASDGTAETTAWIAWEVVAAEGGAPPSITPRAAAYYRMMRSR